MEAIIETGGKQYKVKEGSVLKVEKLTAQKGDETKFDRVLAVLSPEKSVFGKPVVEGASVTGKVLSQARDKKVIVFKYKSKKNYRKRRGHRQSFTEVRIEKIHVS